MFITRLIVTLLIGLLTVGALSACTLADSGPQPTPRPTLDAPPGDQPLIVAWVEAGDLFVWRSSHPQPHRIASGAAIRPLIAPDGAWIAYLRGPGGDPRTLWISDTPGANERQIVNAENLPDTDGERRLNQLVWSADSAAIYFNTITGSGMEAHPADDLWRVDVATGSTERLLPAGSGGMITLSADGTMLALTSTGVYSTDGEMAVPGRITLYTLADGSARVILEFPAVATASQSRWYPALRWLPDSSRIYTAIPAADLVYGEGPTVLWSLPVDGAAEQFGTVDADYFGLPTFSADGAWITYIQRRTTPDQMLVTLMLAESDGSNAVEYVQGAPGTLSPPAWLPGSAQFYFSHGAEGKRWLGGPGTEPVFFPVIPVLPAMELIWADPTTYVFTAPTESGYALYFGLMDVPTPIQEIVSLPAYPEFDARLP